MSPRLWSNEPKSGLTHQYREAYGATKMLLNSLELAPLWNRTCGHGILADARGLKAPSVIALLTFRWQFGDLNGDGWDGRFEVWDGRKSVRSWPGDPAYLAALDLDWTGIIRRRSFRRVLRERLRQFWFCSLGRRSWRQQRCVCFASTAGWTRKRSGPKVLLAAGQKCSVGTEKLRGGPSSVGP